MDNALTPREIQSRIRSGASVDDIATESGMDHDRVEAFAGPVLAEREHMVGAAKGTTIRRRGEAGSHRRLGDLIEQRLRSRGIDADDVSWDAWRLPNLKWRVVARLDGAEERNAEFVFDAKARFSVAENSDARWMIGEETPGAAPEEENTVDFDDELALVRAVSQPSPESPGDDVPASELMHDGNEDTSQLDRLYDMLSGISEDSVRIYTGILDSVLQEEAQAAPEPGREPEPEPELTAEPAKVTSDEPAGPSTPEAVAVDHEEDEPTGRVPREDPAAETDPESEPTQKPLVDTDDEPQKQPKGRRRRAKVPSWDEIMFGGPTK